MKNKKSIILLSGGLDSVVSLGKTIKTHNIVYALIFNYAQSAFDKEFQAAKKIAGHYNINYKVIELDWLKELAPTNSDWIPNRNALFINIAGCYADAEGYTDIIIGANKEEAETFIDNSEEFINAINQSLKYSTQSKVQVTAPLLGLNKQEIIELGLSLDVPLHYIYSCYKGGEKHCGICASCVKLKNALGRVCTNDNK